LVLPPDRAGTGAFVAGSIFMAIVPPVAMMAIVGKSAAIPSPEQTVTDMTVAVMKDARLLLRRWFSGNLDMVHFLFLFARQNNRARCGIRTSRKWRGCRGV
jgi:hypothetical protein